MFITEHAEIKNIKKWASMAVFKGGMPFANYQTVNTRFTFKEVTLILGVFVALIVAFILWSLQMRGHQSGVNTAISLPVAIDDIPSFIQKSATALQLLK